MGGSSAKVDFKGFRNAELENERWLPGEIT